ncbi:hypothetical protein BpHYR1_019296 [Brachionus plicatilis]|uniref:Methyltransferase FkbM domain-containing protein n=1 Tax=Brachionus plicatilis TaxID=10195 RepID=A0A3M7RH34_BRAPC|nr:hypothetical protein BpHYR1_019296 [Brachionus plicatilis]
MIFLNRCSKRLNYCLIFVILVSNDENVILINGLDAKSPFKYIDFSEKICENKKFDSFECIELMKIFVSPVLCIHDPKRDYTSNIIKRTGIKEEKNPESLFIDIGSHVGLYSVYAGKFGHKVIAVEAFIENIYRFHKANGLSPYANGSLLDTKKWLSWPFDSFGKIEKS